MSKNTPTPWKVFARGNVTEVQDGDGKAVASWMGFDDSDRSLAEHRANARLIVRAVNSFDEPLYDEMAKELAAKDAVIGAAREALEEIDRWSRAYPIDIFPEPDFKRANELLHAGGMSIDAVSASNMRHVIERVEKIVAPALAACLCLCVTARRQVPSHLPAPISRQAGRQALEGQ